MLGAILRQPDETWFFKLTGPPDETAALREAFGKFVASTRFENGAPSWEIPAGWTERKSAPGSMRFTTFLVAPNGPELSVMPLPNNEDEIETAVININRWRRDQLGLTALTTEAYLRALESDNDAAEVFPEDEGEIVSITTPAGKAILVDFVKTFPSQEESPRANSQLPQLNPPSHWNARPASTITLAAFEVGEGDDPVRITLSTAGGDLLANVNRWRVQQLGMSAWTESELAEGKQKLSGQGFTADYFKLFGPTETILAAIIPHDGQLWFVKLKGPKALAEKEIENFESFVKSIEF